MGGLTTVAVLPSQHLAGGVGSEADAHHYHNLPSPASLPRCSRLTLLGSRTHRPGGDPAMILIIDY